MRENMMLVFLGLVSFTLHGDFQCHPFLCKHYNSILPYGCFMHHDTFSFHACLPAEGWPACSVPWLLRTVRRQTWMCRHRWLRFTQKLGHRVVVFSFLRGRKGLCVCWTLCTLQNIMGSGACGREDSALHGGQEVEKGEKMRNSYRCPADQLSATRPHVLKFPEPSKMAAQVGTKHIQQEPVFQIQNTEENSQW